MKKSSHFYTVREKATLEPIYGGESVEEAVYYYLQDPLGYRISVSMWYGEGEDIYQVIEPIDVSLLVMEARVVMAREMAR